MNIKQLLEEKFCNFDLLRGNIPNMNFQVSDLRIKNTYGEPCHEEVPGTLRTSFGSLSRTEPGAKFSYRLTAQQSGTTSFKEYFNTNLRPLLESYSQDSDTNEIMKYVGYLEYMMARSARGADRFISQALISGLDEVVDNINSRALCDVTKVVNLKSSNISDEIKPRITSVKLWMPWRENDYKPIYCVEVIQNIFSQKINYFETHTRKIVLEAKTPIAVVTAENLTTN